MQGGKHEMARERRLNCDFGGFAVPYLADHDDVGILPQQCTHAGGEVEVDGRLHLHLIERRLDHLDWIFDRADIYFWSRELF